MRIETIDTIERLNEIALPWDELYHADPHAHFYLSSDFQIAIAIRMTGAFRVLAAWSDDDRCVGLLPMVVQTRWSASKGCLINALDMLGHVFDADYTGLLCDPDFEAEVCTALASEISKTPFARLIINYFRGPESRLQRFIDAFDSQHFETKANEHRINDGQIDNLKCPFVTLPSSFDEYLASLSANSRQKIRRLLRQLASDDTLTISKTRPETYTQDVTILSELWYQKHVGQKGEKRAKRLAELFKEVVMLGLASGAVYLAILRRDGRPVAAQANYLDHTNRRVLFHVGGRDESVRDLSVGLMLQAHCIRWAIAHRFAEFDFTIGNESYKYSLGGVDHHLASREVLTKTGVNIGDKLDPNCQGAVRQLIQRYIAKGRTDQARIAARQAIDTWPTLALDNELKALASD